MVTHVMKVEKRKKEVTQSTEKSHVEDHHIEKSSQQSNNKPEEFGGRQGLEPTRYGDWEKNGRCIDF